VLLARLSASVKDIWEVFGLIDIFTGDPLEPGAEDVAGAQARVTGFDRLHVQAREAVELLPSRGHFVQLNPMGMTCYFVAVSEQDMSDIAANPTLLLTLTLKGEFSAEDMELLGMTEEDSEWEPNVKPKILYVDKAWDGMNFLLSKAGVGFPYTFINAGGIELDATEEDWGYGPPRSFDSAEVQELARMMKDIDVDALFEQADPEELENADVYCFSMDEPKEESIGYFTHYLAELKTFIRDAAAENRALIVYLA
jgi:hypothetical protein